MDSRKVRRVGRSPPPDYGGFRGGGPESVQGPLAVLRGGSALRGGGPAGGGGFAFWGEALAFLGDLSF